VWYAAVARLSSIPFTVDHHMYSQLRITLAAGTLAILSVAPARGQTQSGQPAAKSPGVGDMAPDFSAVATDSTGRAIPIVLSSLRGKVVVLAFYPLDRSSGCTAELNKFRDDYGTLFGDGVVVLPASVDSLSSHASWARDAHFPFALIADPDARLATTYASTAPARKYFNRTIYVIGRDGTVKYVDPRFGALSQDAYDKLASAVRDARGK
jgi:thioredoxin-dependent peroxiredoxin